jgi:hypothetical protein
MNPAETNEVVRHIARCFPPMQAVMLRSSLAVVCGTRARYTNNRIATTDAATVVDGDCGRSLLDPVYQTIVGGVDPPAWTQCRRPLEQDGRSSPTPPAFK